MAHRHPHPTRMTTTTTACAETIPTTRSLRRDHHPNIGIMVDGPIIISIIIITAIGIAARLLDVIARETEVHGIDTYSIMETTGIDLGRAVEAGVAVAVVIEGTIEVALLQTAIRTTAATITAIMVTMTMTIENLELEEGGGQGTTVAAVVNIAKDIITINTNTAMTTAMAMTMATVMETGIIITVAAGTGAVNVDAEPG